MEEEEASMPIRYLEEVGTIREEGTVDTTTTMVEVGEATIVGITTRVVVGIMEEVTTTTR